MSGSESAEPVRTVHYHAAVRVLDSLHPVTSPGTEARIAAAQVHALLELADAIRSLNE